MKTTKAISSSNFELLMKFYNHEIPGYVKHGDKSSIVIHVSDYVFGDRDIKITLEEVIKYVTIQV